MPEPKRYKKGKHIYTKWGKNFKEVKTMPEENLQKPVQVQIEIDDTTAQGIYTNLAFITHNETEFTLDFIYVQPQQPKAKLRARIISSPIHTKKFLQALMDNLRKYEDKFGEIKVPVIQEQKVEFGNA
ncbi:MAG: DUF3467 domain-containing protein [Elusimicrobiota bacterium]